MSRAKYDFGLVGLGVMGRNFILNVADHGFSAIGLDNDTEKAESLKKEGNSRKVTATTDKLEFVRALKAPRKIMMLVPSGPIVDAVIEDLMPFLDKGDLLIDGGNSFFMDTERRITKLKNSGIEFLGLGISGGAKGARLGPSMMAGGSPAVYDKIRPILESVSAKVQDEPCVSRVGEMSAGHYVKMVHNGIEYGLMQLIAETYDLAKYGLGYSNDQIARLFKEFNEGRLKSYLIEITANIFSKKDDLSDQDLVDMISDKAKQKGTGKWISQNAMDIGVPIPAIDASVSMRALSSFKSEREKATYQYPKSQSNPATFTVEELEASLYFGFIITFSQGMRQLLEASEKYHYGLDLAEIAKIWRGGCIIRAELLEKIRQAFSGNAEINHLLFDPFIVSEINAVLPALNKVVGVAHNAGIPVAGLSASLNYFNAFRSSKLPLNLIQAQRDYFGGHTYERLDREGIFHTEWD